MTEEPKKLTKPWRETSYLTMTSCEVCREKRKASEERRSKMNKAFVA